MATIVPKLNLNKTPNKAYNNGLVFAKNIRLDTDESIHRDYSISPLGLKGDTYAKNIFDKAIVDIRDRLLEMGSSAANYNDYQAAYEKLMDMVGYTTSEEKAAKHKCSIVGIIPDSTEFYLCLYSSYKASDEEDAEVEEWSMIVVYNEETELITPCNCNWNYSGGVIDGCVINNILGEKILNIAEKVDDGLVPLKCINLSKSTINDDENNYTQMPSIPITNLKYKGTFSFVVPNGVYQFFIRYKIRNNHYTEWFPASRELFIGNKRGIITNFGSLNYINTHTDSDYSVIFGVEHLYSDFVSNYKKFQIGFICSHDDAVYGRAWKHFDMSTGIIQFDYDSKDAEEVEITEFTKPGFQLYNVGNITSFKNKLYVSNYKETDFNENLQKYADKVNIEFKELESQEAYGGYGYRTSTVGATDYVSALIDTNNVETEISGENGVIHQLMSLQTSASTTIEDCIQNCIAPVEDTDLVNTNSSAFACSAYCMGDTLAIAKNDFMQSLEASGGFDSIQFGDNTVHKIVIDGHQIGGTTKEAVLEYIYNYIAFLSFNGFFTNASGNAKSEFVIDFYRRATYSKTVYTNTGSGINGGVNPGTGTGNGTLIGGSSGTITGGGTGDNVGGGVIPSIITRTEEYVQSLYIRFTAYSEKFGANSQNLTDYTTLIPYQKYKFYIHFIKQNGEISNGFYCSTAGEIEAEYQEECNKIIYPKFSGIELPKGYKACFFSILHTAVNSATVFNIIEATNFEASCVEANTRLIPVSNAVECRQGDNNVFAGNYFDSNDGTLARYFGCDGVITFNNMTSIDPSKLAYLTTNYSSQQDTDAQLVKCTPFIKNNAYEDYTNMNLCGYVCKVLMLDRERCINYYSDGSSVYKKTNADDISAGNNNNVFTELKELGNYTDSDPAAKDFGLRITSYNYIYSNFNLNFIELSEDPKPVIRTVYDYSSEATNNDSMSHVSRQLLWRLVPSLIMSSVYQLPSMFYKYPRKTYSVYSKDDVVEFNNTVRSSILEGDETSISIFKFDPDDYYNIPTNRGIIVNLVAIGDSILVHTKSSMFKFNGSNNLTSSKGEILTNESQPFDTGVSEVFGSDFGYAGLQNKKHHIITENGYIFYDMDSQIIYIYSGNNQIMKLSDSIEKLLRRKPLKNIYFANDFYNNRFFVSIEFIDGFATLSFSTLSSVRSFVSLHDFYFTDAFNTKTKCYFVSTDKLDICRINKESYCRYMKVQLLNDKIYPSSSTDETIKLNLHQADSSSPETEETTYTIRNNQSIIDVICNSNYETVKTLNSISFCSRFVDSEFKDINTNDLLSLKMADVQESNLAALALRIYTDTCITEKLDLDERANDYSISNPNSYKLPRYNQGTWSLNYFRDIQNTNDIYKYLKPVGDTSDQSQQLRYKYDDGRQKATYRSDNNSLVEGKYFVARFFYNDEFKLESVTFNYNNKI